MSLRARGPWVLSIFLDHLFRGSRLIDLTHRAVVAFVCTSDYDTGDGYIMEYVHPIRAPIENKIQPASITSIYFRLISASTQGTYVVLL